MKKGILNVNQRHKVILSSSVSQLRTILMNLSKETNSMTLIYNAKETKRRKSITEMAIVKISVHDRTNQVIKMLFFLPPF